MDINASNLFAGVVVSAVGFGIFVYGKKQRRVPQLVAGVVLMGFPYFTSSAAATYAIAGAIVAATWIAVRCGI